MPIASRSCSNASSNTSYYHGTMKIKSVTSIQEQLTNITKYSLSYDTCAWNLVNFPSSRALCAKTTVAACISNRSSPLHFVIPGSTFSANASNCLPEIKKKLVWYFQLNFLGLHDSFYLYFVIKLLTEVRLFEQCRMIQQTLIYLFEKCNLTILNFPWQLITVW